MEKEQDNIQKQTIDLLKMDYLSVFRENEIEIATLTGDAICSTALPFPIFSTIKAIWNVPGKIREQNFARNLVKFITNVGDVTPELREKAIIDIEKKGEDYAGNILTTLLDRLDNINKSVILANLYKSLIREDIDAEDFLRLSNVLERISYVDIKHLDDYQVNHYKAGESESLYASGTIYQSVIDNGDEDGNMYILSKLGFQLLKYGLNVDVAECENKQRTKATEAITDERLNQILS